VKSSLRHLDYLFPPDVTDEADHKLKAAGQVRRKAWSPLSPSNVYGNVAVSGHASVHLGDTHIHQGLANAPFDVCTDLPLFISRKSLQVASATFCERRTTSMQQYQHWLLLWFITISRQVTNIKTSHGTTITLFVAFEFFNKFVLQWSMQMQNGHRLTLGTHRPKWRNIVAVDSAFMCACARGDIAAMRSLVASGQASIDDVTEYNESPLQFAITNRHLHAVQWLLDNGAEVDATFGSRQTSPVGWALHQRDPDIVRLLLSRGAGLEYISGHGWSPPFFLWIDEYTIRPSCLYLLQLLYGTDTVLFEYAHRGLVDINGWSILDRAASMGTPDEVEFLLEHGVDLHSRMGELEWNPLFNAVYDGRLENLKVMLPYYPGFVVKGRDLRGWTLLHLAAAEGHDHIVRHLLQLGADWQAKTWPSFTHIQEELYGRYCTPAELARAETEERCHQFRLAVEDICLVNMSETSEC